MTPAPARSTTSRMGDIAFMATIAAAYLATFVIAGERLALFNLLALLVLGVLYVVLGTYAFGHYCLAGSMPVIVGYFVTQLVIGGLILYLSPSPGQLWLIWLPLMAHAVVLLPRRGQIAFGVVLMTAFGSVYWSPGGWTAAIQAGLSYGAAVLFVALFTQSTLTAEKARTQVERLAADLRAANDKLRDYAAQVEELAITKERNRLAREIHDSLGHYLTVINVQLEAAQTVLNSDPPHARAALSKAQSLAQEGLKDVRRSVAALRASPTGDRSLPEAIRPLLDDCRTAGIVAELTVCGAVRPLSPQVELTLYRTAQEALTNVRKHACASRVDVSLDYGDAARVQLVVHDNGVGAADPTGGFGLLGLRERVQLLGGAVRFDTAPGQGVRLEVGLPG